MSWVSSKCQVVSLQTSGNKCPSSPPTMNVIEDVTCHWAMSLQSTVSVSRRLLLSFQQLHNDLQVALLDTFYPITVDEWLVTNFATKLKELTGIVTTAEKQMVRGGKPNSCTASFNSVETNIP